MKCETVSTCENFSPEEIFKAQPQRSQSQKETIFLIKNYQFLRKKRQESMEKIQKKKPWTSDLDQKLTLLITNYPHLSWAEISSYFEDRSQIQCLHRWTKVLMPGLKKGKWSKEEDEILLKWVEKEGAKNWGKLTIPLKGRSSKQIRDRWVNNLNPGRSNFHWTEELDKLLLMKYIQRGSSWVSISKLIKNSTENMIKNRFYSMLRSCASRYSKKKKTDKQRKMKEQLDHLLKIKDKRKEFDQFLVFDFEEEKTETNNLVKNKYKRKNPSLTELIEYLPNLLEEKGIDINQIQMLKEENEREREREYMATQNRIEIAFSKNLRGTVPSTSNTNLSSLTMNGYSFNFNDEQKQILTNFFTTLTEKFQPFDTAYSGKESEPALIQKTSESQKNFKSTILLNLQLTILNRIFERLKVQFIQKFFECFKENTLSGQDIAAMQT